MMPQLFNTTAHTRVWPVVFTTPAMMAPHLQCYMFSLHFYTAHH